jgi:hypothetical protein
MELAEVLIIEAKQYTDGSSRVVIPLLFGFTEQARQLKKSITISQDSLRRKWDESSFFEDAKGRHALTSSKSLPLESFMSSVNGMLMRLRGEQVLIEHRLIRNSQRSALGLLMRSIRTEHSSLTWVG